MTATTRRTTRLRPIHFVLSLLLALAGVVAIGGPARATGPGEIDGHLTDTTLAPGNIYLDGFDVYLYDSVGTYIDSTVSGGGGYFSFTGVVSDDYYLYVYGGSDYMDLDSGDFTFDDSDATSGDRGDINLTPAIHLSGRALDPDGDPIPDVIVFIEGLPSGELYFADDLTDINGNYDVRLPGGEEYSLQAIETSFPQLYWDQIYNHLAVTCACSQPVTELNIPVGHADLTGINFELHPLTHVQFDWLATEDPSNNPIPGLTIHIYKKVTGGYQEVEPGTTHSGAYDTGYVTSYGPGAGDYRFRFSFGSTYVAATGWFDSFASIGGPGGCYIDLNGLADGDAFQMEVTFDPLSVVSCGPEPAVVPPSSGGTPPKKRVFFGGGGTLVAPTPTPTPSATPTSSPSPSSSPSSSPDPSETPDPTEPTTDTGFPWWIILIIVLILGIIVTIIVIVRRR